MVSLLCFLYTFCALLVSTHGVHLEITFMNNYFLYKIQFSYCPPLLIFAAGTNECMKTKLKYSPLSENSKKLLQIVFILIHAILKIWISLCWKCCIG